MTSAPGTVTGRVTVERALPDDVIDDFWHAYTASMAPMAETAAARQLLFRAEFDEEMADPTILKYLGRDAEDRPVAMCWMTTNLEAIPWIGADFYAKQFPEHHARDAIYYFGEGIVRPDARRQGWLKAIFERMAMEIVANRGIAAWDCSATAVERFGIPDLGDMVLSRFAEVERRTLDTQTYFSLEVLAPKPVPDDLDPRVVIDLTDGEPTIDLTGLD